MAIHVIRCMLFQSLSITLHFCFKVIGTKFRVENPACASKNTKETESHHITLPRSAVGSLPHLYRRVHHLLCRHRVHSGIHRGNPHRASEPRSGRGPVHQRRIGRRQKFWRGWTWRWIFVNKSKAATGVRWTCRVHLVFVWYHAIT